MYLKKLEKDAQKIMVSNSELDLILDVNMYLLFEKGMRSVVSCISERYSNANNKYFTSYDPKKLAKYITYLDKNSLYGYPVSKFIINNAIYDKTKENLRNRVDEKQVYNKNDCLQQASKTSFVTQKIFDNNLMVIHKIKISLKLNKLAFVGMCILELSKGPMYEFYYDYIETKYDKKQRYLQLGV